MRSYEDSLQRLGMNRIDILFIHDVDSFTHGKDAQPGMFRKAMESAYKALDELRSSGEVKAIGIGVNEAKPIADALPHGRWDCFLLAGRYTLLEQAPLADLLPALAKHGASVIVGGPFNSGILVGGDTWNYARAPEDVLTRVEGDCARLRLPTRSRFPPRRCNFRWPIRSSPASFPAPAPPASSTRSCNGGRIRSRPRCGATSRTNG